MLNPTMKGKVTMSIMRKQNEITLKLKQQSLSSLPKRDLNVFDGDTLQYHAFMRAFENSVEIKTDNYSDRLYSLKSILLVVQGG